MKKMVYFLSVIAFLSLTGCNMFEWLSDDSSDAADIEDARIALNDGNYQEAIDILEPGFNQSDPDAETAQILSSAYMGKAGIDLTYILENADNSEGQSFDVISSALSIDIVDSITQEAAEQGETKAVPSTAKYISYSSATAFLTSLETARLYLAASVTANGLDDDKVQLGMVSAVHFILKIGVTAADLRDTNIPINKKAYQEVFPNSASVNTLLTDLSNAINADQAVVDSLQDDVTYVYNAVNVLITRIGSDEELAEEFNDFMRELLGLGASATNADILAAINTFDGPEISAYINTKLLDY